MDKRAVHTTDVCRVIVVLFLIRFNINFTIVLEHVSLFQQLQCFDIFTPKVASGDQMSQLEIPYDFMGGSISFNM